MALGFNTTVTIEPAVKPDYLLTIDSAIPRQVSVPEIINRTGTEITSSAPPQRYAG